MKKTKKKKTIHNLKCKLEKTKKCGSKNRSKNNYDRKSLESIYKKCFPNVTKFELKRKNMDKLCSEINLKQEIVNKKYMTMNQLKQKLKTSSHLIQKLDYGFNDIKNRKKFIDAILGGEILITNLKIDYPYQLSKFPSTGKKVLKSYPFNVLYVMKLLNGNIKFLSDEKGNTGYPFKLCFSEDCNEEKIGIKLLPFVRKYGWYSKECIDKKLNSFRKKEKNNLSYPQIEKNLKLDCIQEDRKRPENVESKLLFMFSSFVLENKTPHIILPIMTFTCKISELLNLYPDKPPKKILLQNVKNYEDFNLANVLITEWASEGDLENYIKKNLKKWSPETATLKLTIIFFQILFTFLIIYIKYPNFRHNDLKPNNILVSKTQQTQGYYLYNYNNIYFKIPNIGIQIKLWDFDLSCIDGEVYNYKVNNMENFGIKLNKNHYYDIHTFLNYILLYTIKIKNMPLKIKKFIHKIIPKNYRYYENFPYTYWARIIDDQEIKPISSIFYDEYTSRDGLFFPFIIEKSKIKDIKFINKYNY